MMVKVKIDGISDDWRRDAEREYARAVVSILEAHNARIDTIRRQRAIAFGVLTSGLVLVVLHIAVALIG